MWETVWKLILGVAGLFILFEWGVGALTEADKGQGRWIAITIIAVSFSIGVILLALSL